MSIRRRADRGRGYEVRWREGGRERSRTFTLKRDAEVFELEVKRRRQLGSVMFTQLTAPTLAETLWRIFSAAAAALITEAGVSPQELIADIERLAG